MVDSMGNLSEGQVEVIARITGESCLIPHRPRLGHARGVALPCRGCGTRAWARASRGCVLATSRSGGTPGLLGLHFTNLSIHTLPFTPPYALPPPSPWSPPPASAPPAGYLNRVIDAYQRTKALVLSQGLLVLALVALVVAVLLRWLGWV